MISPTVTNRAAATLPLLSRELAPTALTCVAVEGEAEFRALESLWRELTDRATNRSPSLCWSWLASWWEVFGVRCPKTGRAGVPYVVLVYAGTTPVAAYPFVSHITPWWNMNLRRLRPMGHSGELEPSGLTEEALCAVATGYEERARAVVLDHLAEAVARGQWDCAIIRQLNHDEAPIQIGSRRGTCVATKVKPGPQIVRLPECWAAFRKQLSKSMRDNLAYYPRLIHRAGHTYEVSIHTGGEPLQRASRDLVRLHRGRVLSEIGQKHQDYFPDEWQPRMLETGMARLGQEGRGFVATLEIDGAVVAAQSFIQTESELLAHYSGFDPQYAKYSPLLVLQAEVFRRGIEEWGIRKLNLLFGSAPWQKRWSANSEGQEARVIILSPRPIAILRSTIYAIARETVAYTRRSGLRRWWGAFAHTKKPVGPPNAALRILKAPRRRFQVVRDARHAVGLVGLRLD